MQDNSFFHPLLEVVPWGVGFKSVVFLLVKNHALVCLQLHILLAYPSIPYVLMHESPHTMPPSLHPLVRVATLVLHLLVVLLLQLLLQVFLDHFPVFLEC